MNDKISDLADSIITQANTLKTKKATAGFDGFIDTLVKIIKSKQPKQPPSLFNRIREFGDYIVEKSASSFSLEAEEVSIKLGGNMPIMANAMATLGVSVNCVGALGYPQPHPVFKNLSSNCKLYSFTEPGTCTAFEFDDGKIMLGQMDKLNAFGWDKVKHIIGIETLIDLYRESDLFCMVNWSEIDASGEIWKGVLKDVLPSYARNNVKQIAFFDLSDCSKRSRESIQDVLDLLNEFARYTKVILSLNKNEAGIVYEVFNKKTADRDLAYVGQEIFKKMQIDTLVLHSSKEAIAVNREGAVASNSFFIAKPVISTGAGDHFNAGFAVAQLLALSMESSLIFANAVSGLYVKTGITPQVSDISDFLKGKV